MLSITTDQLSAAASYIAREWGDYGYRVEGVESWTERVTLFFVVHHDGSRFVVGADSWGNCRHAASVDWRGYRTAATTAAMGEFVSEMHAAASLV
jgi:hypothetical protein